MGNPNMLNHFNRGMDRHRSHYNTSSEDVPLQPTLVFVDVEVLYKDLKRKVEIKSKYFNKIGLVWIG